MFGLGVGEIVIILVVALIFIGPKKLPELARGLGKGLREFQNATKGISESIQNPTPSEPQKLDDSRHEVSQNETVPLDQAHLDQEHNQKK